MKSKSIIVLDSEIRMMNMGEDSEYLSLSDMARNFGEPKDIIRNWMRNRASIAFMRVWEKIQNPEFNEEKALVFEFNSGTPSFSMSPSKWVEETNAVGIWVKQGRGGAVFAHEDLALEFGMYLSPEFKVYLVNEFKKLKKQEQEKLNTDWKFKRELSKVFYRVHTDSIEEYLIPPEVRKSGLDRSIYANEANILNKALFGKTAAEWRKENPEKEGNMRDWATPAQLVMLSMLESQNAFLISKEVSPEDRLELLNETARKHMKSILAKPKNLGKLLKLGKEEGKKLKE